MSNELNFDDLALIELPVSIAGVKYTLREASESAAAQYQNQLAKYTKVNADGKYQGANGPLADCQALLVSLCVFDENGNHVKQINVKNWPTRIVKRLFAKATEISEMAGETETEESLQKGIDELQEKLDKLREDALGNEQSDTADASD